jgi:hypothetical protein
MHRKPISRNPRYRTTIRRAATIAAVAIPTLIAAATPAVASSTVAADTTPLAVNDLPTVIGNMTTWVTGIIAAVATLFLTIGGAQYLMAGGDPAQVERAKGSLKSAGIGYALALLAPVILTILKNILGG